MKGKTKREFSVTKSNQGLQFFVKEFCKVGSLKRNSPKTVNGKDMTFAWEDQKPTRDLCKRASWGMAAYAPNPLPWR